ncbi:Trypsin-like peptidase domain-containing protein [Verrucomicrobium sp. GAS474]|uniref:S1 family peptidase n=1 Tax=Verrucomicrobium sp. GAS474 TaxID=1882831 RepID=UPI00087CB83F|nr:serine protease [Verrucomicrobium sp. GAS474]SDU17051.1 Trypsin-like peptidase domain-containing protein [Verrucomicrobium sp. GAS474]
MRYITALLLTLSLLSVSVAEDAAPPDPAVVFIQARALIAKAKETSNSGAQLSFLSMALRQLRSLPPSTKYKGHRGEAVEALSSIMGVNMPIGLPPGAVMTSKPTDPAKISDAIDVALQEIDLAVLAWSGVDSPGSDSTPVVKADAKAVTAPSESESAALQSVVIIKGDQGQGTGFLVKTADGPCVITNLHVLFNNPNLKITTPGGDEVVVTTLKGAADRDLAQISIEDKGYKYLELASDVSKEAQIGDDLITPGNSKGGEVILPTRGKLLASGNQKVEFDNPIYHGNSGGPVFDVKIGKVIGVVTQAVKVNTGNELDKASFNSKNSAITGSMRYFGYRVDSVSKWETYDWGQFLGESKFVDDFHSRSEALDSYLNGDEKKPNGISATLYMQDDPIRLAHLEFRSQIDHSIDGSTARGRAVNQLIVTLRNLADMQCEEIDRSIERKRFYGYTLQRAKEEVAYRKELKDELDHLSETFDRR